jgi:hypothetical protein
MRYARTLAGWLAAALIGGAVEAQAPAPQDPAPADPPAPQQPPPAGQPQTPPAQGGPRRPAGNTDVFIPTEEIAADEEVTFPVDI